MISFSLFSGPGKKRQLRSSAHTSLATRVFVCGLLLVFTLSGCAIEVGSGPEEESEFLTMEEVQEALDAFMVGDYPEEVDIANSDMMPVDIADGDVIDAEELQALIVAPLPHTPSSVRNMLGLLLARQGTTAPLDRAVSGVLSCIAIAVQSDWGEALISLLVGAALAYFFPVTITGMIMLDSVSYGMMIVYGIGAGIAVSRMLGRPHPSPQEVAQNIVSSLVTAGVVRFTTSVAVQTLARRAQLAIEYLVSVASSAATKQAFKNLPQAYPAGSSRQRMAHVQGAASVAADYRDHWSWMCSINYGMCE